MTLSKEKYREYRKKYDVEHKEEIQAYMKKYREEHGDDAHQGHTSEDSVLTATPWISVPALHVAALQ